VRVEVFLVRDGCVRKHRHSGRPHHVLGFDLGAHRRDCLWAGPDENHPYVRACLREISVLGKKSVAWMDGISSCERRCGEDQITSQIGVGGCSAGQMHRFGGLQDVGGIPVGIGVHGNRVDVHVACGADDPRGDLPPVGDEQLVDHDLTS
jgi:hypothetical protein